MTCVFHEIGAFVELAQAQKTTIRGRNLVLPVSTRGVVRGINRSSHTLRVYFSQIKGEVNLPASAFVARENTEFDAEA